MALKPIAAGKKEVRSPGMSEHVLARFTLTASATPSIASDPDNVVETSVTDNGAGDYTVTLSHRYYALTAFANVQAAAGNYHASVVPTASLTADNTLRIVVFDSDATAALGDPTATVDVLILGRRNDAGA